MAHVDAADSAIFEIVTFRKHNPTSTNFSSKDAKKWAKDNPVVWQNEVDAENAKGVDGGDDH